MPETPLTVEQLEAALPVLRRLADALEAARLPEAYWYRLGRDQHLTCGQLACRKRALYIEYTLASRAVTAWCPACVVACRVTMPDPETLPIWHGEGLKDVR